MHKPHLSTGAWIFTAAVFLVVALPTGVYAAAKVSAVHIQDGKSSTLASVDPEGQLLSAQAAPANTVHIYQDVSGEGCSEVYNPPTGKALVITSVTYDLGGGSAGGEVYGFLYGTSTCADSGSPVDLADTTQAYESFQHTFPTGLPVASLGYQNQTEQLTLLTVTGYLIPASELPATTPAGKTVVSKPRR